MNLLWVLVVILVIFAIAGAPHWPYATSWGWYPSGGLGLIVVVLIILLLMGRL